MCNTQAITSLGQLHVDVTDKERSHQISNNEDATVESDNEEGQI